VLDGFWTTRFSVEESSFNPKTCKPCETLKSGGKSMGSLSAHLVILDHDLGQVDPWEIKNITVERILIGGETVYQAP
jgi:hypothetical protein